MSTLAKIPAALDLAATVGSDLILAVTVNENDSPYDFDGATIETAIFTIEGTTSATNFTTSTLNNVLTLTLSDTATTALAADTYRWELRVTKSNATSPWLGGTLTISPRGIGGTSASSATLSITTAPTVTLDLAVGFGVIPDAEAVPFTPADPLTETNVQDALMELATAVQARIPTVKSSVFIADNATLTQLTQNVAAKVVGAFTAGPACMNCTYNSNRITYTGARATRVLALASVDLTAGNNTTLLLELRKNGQAVTGVRTKVRHGSTVASASLIGYIELAQNDFVELWVTNVTDNSDATITDATFALMN